MKDDVPGLPAYVPRKRHQVRRLLDLHIAMWLGGDSIAPEERELLEAEKARRKHDRLPVHVGVLTAASGVTPAQRAWLRERIDTLDPTTMTVGMGAELKELVRDSTVVLAALPRGRRAYEGPVWEAVRLARKRGLMVQVVKASGEELSDGD